jgi:hypothetical protein
MHPPLDENGFHLQDHHREAEQRVDANDHARESRIDEDVERAFDLMGHYKDLLQEFLDPGHDEERQRALPKLEAVLRQWLPRALPANSPLITAVLDAVGHREKAKSLLDATDLWAERKACLTALAAAAPPAGSPAADAIAQCRATMHHWRSQLPGIWRDPNGNRRIGANAQRDARLVGWYWSMSLESRPSRLGASYFLAAACEAVVSAARREGIVREDTKPAIRLAQRLREHPDWVGVDEQEVVQVLDEQIELARQVEELLTDIEHGPSAPMPSIETGQHFVVARNKLHAAAKRVAGSLSSLMTIIGPNPEVGHALALLDQQVLSPASDSEPDGPDHAAAWQSVIRDLRTHLAEARGHWEATVDGVDRRVALAFAQASQGEIVCGPIRRGTYHEVLIAVGHLLLDPQDPNGIWENELGAISEPVGASADRVRNVARLRVARQLTDRSWWQAMKLAIDREFADVLDQAGSGERSDTPPPAKDQGTFSGTSEAAVTAIVRAVEELRREWPDSVPNKKQIKVKAAKSGGAGDRAIERAIDLKLVSPDFRVTEAGRHFLAERS